MGSEETHHASPTKWQPSDTCAARTVPSLEQAVLWGQLLPSQCSPAIHASSACVFVLFTHHQPASASPAAEHRGGSEAGVKRWQKWWGGALLAALLHEIFNFKLFFSTFWGKGLVTLTHPLNFAFNAVLSLLLVPLIQPRSRGLSGTPHAPVPLHPAGDGRPITERPWNAMYFWKRGGWYPVEWWRAMNKS